MCDSTHTTFSLSPSPSSRRSFLGGAAALLAGSAVVKAVPSATVDPAGPITPEEWATEMRQNGWTVLAGDFRGQPCGVIERGPGNWDVMIRINRRVNSSGPDFYQRAARYLFDLGLRETVGPAHV